MRRLILALGGGCTLALGLTGFATKSPAEEPTGLQQQTPYLHVTFDGRQPGLSALSFDALRQNAFLPSPIVDPGKPGVAYEVGQRNGWVRYALATDPQHPVWEMRAEGSRLLLRSHYSSGAAAGTMVWKFNPYVIHATLLGRLNSAGAVRLPAVLHLPGMGSLRVFAKGNATAALEYDARRAPNVFVKVGFPAATAAHPLLEYTLETAAIYPALAGIEGDPRFDGFRRDFLDIFQQHAELHVLANHAASDACAFTLYEYADMARVAPELVHGLTALDLIRDSLDLYLNGFLGYGLPGYKMFDGPPETGPSTEPWVYSDVYPSLLISAWDYADGSGDNAWLRANYPALRKWAEAMTAPNADGSPLLEYPASGNSGSWPEKITVRPANWWDTVGFGHMDAYSNALGYRALRGMAAMAERAGQPEDAARYRARADAMRGAYAPAFLDKDAGVLAGWRSQDSQLHNYWFPYITGIAVRYGLLDDPTARSAMASILAKMQKVGYTDFSLGLPGNLIPIRKADYVDLDPKWGGPKLEDGSDGFQIYENGGATASFAYFTPAALYSLGEKEEGDRILLPMLGAIARQGFSGRTPEGLSNDWKDWKGNPHGYEGFLVDNYYALLAVLDRAGKMPKIP